VVAGISFPYWDLKSRINTIVIQDTWILTLSTVLKALFTLCKKENKIFLINKEIQMGWGAKLYMRKGFLIYEKMGKYLTIYLKAVRHISLCSRSLLFFLIYEENVNFIFYQCKRIGGRKGYSKPIYSPWG
jgi:hypothetical protein